jgi:Trypsin-like peptidase domain
MTDLKKLEKYSATELYHELMAREGRQLRGGLGHDSSINQKLSLFSSTNIVSMLRKKQSVIYGVDDRQDLYEVKNERFLESANSVVALFRSYDTSDRGDGTSELSLVNFGEARDLCASERFREQPAGASCSGFLVAPKIIATTSHCINVSNVQNERFVFGFKMNAPGDPTTRIDNSEIYRGSRIIGGELTANGPDWALVELDRPVENHPPVKIRSKGKIEDRAPVYVIGHPCGLPMKFSSGANVRDNESNTIFVANLDSFGGNPGSPVFNSETHEVEGVVSRGEADFVPNDNCYVSLICPTSGCRGFDCTRTATFFERIQKYI